MPIRWCRSRAASRPPTPFPARSFSSSRAWVTPYRSRCGRRSSTPSPGMHDEDAAAAPEIISARRRRNRRGARDVVKHDYAEVNGVRLHYAMAGTGKLMLFVHGFPEFWYAWKDQLAEFGRDHCAVALDMRGYNLSAKPA